MTLLRSITTAVGIALLGATAAGLGTALPTLSGPVGVGLLAAGLSASSLPDRAVREQGRRQAPNPSFYLDGAFYQPDLAEGFADPERRRAEFERMAAGGARTIWLQYLAHGDFSLLDPWPERIDPVRGLLDDAKSAGLTVWLGTREDPRVWSKDEVPVRIWKDAGDRALLIAEEAAARYGTHPALAGWYWTPEVVWPREPGPRRVQRLAAISRAHIRRLRTLVPGLPVAVVLGPGGHVGEEIPARGWCRWIEVVRPDVLVVMDGVGTGHVDVTQLDAVYAAAAGCADRVGARLVADVEVFGPSMKPDPVRLIRQMQAAERRASEVVAFDLPHHLKADSVAALLLAGRGPAGVALEAEAVRAPVGDWLSDRPALATLDFVPVSPVRLQGVEIVTRSPHPEALSIALDDGSGFAGAGSMEPFHGPGRDEFTWRWSGDQPCLAARVTLRVGSGGLDVLTSRLRGDVAVPAEPDPSAGQEAPAQPALSPEEVEVQSASPSTPPPG